MEQKIIISIKDETVVPGERRYEGKWGKGCITILSNTEHKDLVLMIHLPDGELAQEIILDKEMFKTYVAMIDGKAPCQST